MTLAQIGFLAVNIFVMPTSRLLKERQEALSNRVIKRERKKEEEDPNEFPIEYELNPDYDSATFFQRLRRLKYSEIFSFKNVKENMQEQPILTLGLFSAATLVSSAFFMYARRTVHMITILPGERVRFAFFSPTFSKPPTIELPLREVSCVSGRKSKYQYSILKLRNYRGYHLVHKTEGQFIDPKMYDKYLGYKRSWAGN